MNLTVGDRIIAARKARDMTRGELVRATGIPYPTLAGIENGDQSSSTKLHVLAEALGVHPRWLESGKGPRDLVVPGLSDWVEVEATPGPEGSPLLPGVRLPASQLHARDLRAGALRLYYSFDDAMQPRIGDGDAVVYDTADRRHADDGLFVVRWAGRDHVKTLQVIGETWHLVADATTDPRWRKPVPIALGVDCEVLGRVCWVGRWES